MLSGAHLEPSTQTKTNLQVKRSSGTAGVTDQLGSMWGGELTSKACWKSVKKILVRGFLLIPRTREDWSDSWGADRRPRRMKGSYLDKVVA